MKPLVPALVAGAIALMSGQVHASVPELEALVAKKAAILALIHKKAKKALVNAAQDENYSAYFQAATDAEKAQFKESIDQISLTVQSRFHIEEMCLINTHGAEVSRIVHNKIAHDLSTDETGAVFFGPGFRQQPRKVHISPIYMSPDVNKWVIAYTTPIVALSKKTAILHYERGLEFYQATLNKGVTGTTILVAIGAGDWIMSDSRKSINIARQGESEDLAVYFEKFAADGMSLKDIQNAVGGNDKKGAGLFETGANKFEVAYKKVGHWTLAAIEKL